MTHHGGVAMDGRSRCRRDARAALAAMPPSGCASARSGSSRPVCSPSPPLHLLAELWADRGLPASIRRCTTCPVILYLAPIAYASLRYGIEGAFLTGVWCRVLTVPNIARLPRPHLEWLTELVYVGSSSRRRRHGRARRTRASPAPTCRGHQPPTRAAQRDRHPDPHRRPGSHAARGAGLPGGGARPRRRLCRRRRTGDDPTTLSIAGTPSQPTSPTTGGSPAWRLSTRAYRQRPCPRRRRQGPRGPLRHRPARPGPAGRVSGVLAVATRPGSAAGPTTTSCSSRSATSSPSRWPTPASRTSNVTVSAPTPGWSPGPRRRSASASRASCTTRPPRTSSPSGADPTRQRARGTRGTPATAGAHQPNLVRAAPLQPRPAAPHSR
jgi:hypothetical protein